MEPANAQQDVFSRSDAGTGLWWNDTVANYPWFYQTWNNNQNRPDQTVNTANFVKIGHNNNLTMTVNGTFFWLGSLEIQSSATANRTYNSSDSGGWSFRTSDEGFTNNSTGNQTVNVEVGIDASNVLFRANASNNNTFTANFYLNGNTADFGGSSSDGRFTLNGIVSGSGGKIVKNGTGTLWLGNANTFTGGVTLNDGTIRFAANSTVAAGTVTSGSFGTGTLTINGGRIFGGGAGALYVPTMLVSNNFALNAGSYSDADNGRLSFAGIMDLAGGTRTITLGRWTNALGALQGGRESWRFFSNNALAATITNGTVRFARDAAGTDSDFVSVNFSSGMAIGTNVGITIGSNIITTIASSDPWGTATNPILTVEEGGYFNISTDINARNARVQSLSGAGIVTSLANAASAQSTTLTVSNVGDTDSSTFSGRIVDGNLLNGTLGTSANNVTVALTKAGAGTLTLTGSNNYSGTTTITSGGLQLGNSGTTGSLGTSGAFVNNGTLIFNRSDSITQGTDFNSAGISGSGSVIKLGAGTLTFNAGNSYSGSTDISNGAVRVSNATGLGNTTGGTTVRSGAALELTGGISIGSEALALNGSGISSGGALRNISGDNTYGGAITLGSASRIASDSGLLALSSTINNAGFSLAVSGAGNVSSSAAISGAGGLDKSGAGTLTLSGGNNFTGKTAITGGAVSINADSRLGSAPGSFTADQLTLSDGGKLITTTAFTFNANRGITLGTGGGGIEVTSGLTTTAGQTIAGSGSLTKSGDGTLTLSTGTSTFSGGVVLNSGALRVTAAGTAAGGVVSSSAIGTGSLTINGGILLGGVDVIATNIFINGNFAVNDATSGLNGRLGLVGNIDNAGLTNTVSLGRFQNAAGVLRTDGNGPSLRFATNGGFTPIITNGAMRFVRGSTGTVSDFVGLNFANQTLWADGSGLTIGTNVITTFGGSGLFTGGAALPWVELEDGGYLNLGTSNNVNNQTIRSLAGTAGYVTTLATLASTNTATLTISNNAGDYSTFGGQIVTGSTLNSALGTTSTNAAIAITKTGQGTQVLSGVNTYGGNTTIAEGVLVFANTSAKSVDSQVTTQASAVIGLGVGGVGGYDTATINTIISNTASGYTMNIGSIVGIDTTAGNFDYSAGIANSRELWKLGANTLTLSAGSGRTGATVVAGGTLELNAISGQAAGGTPSIAVLDAATLLIAKSDQVNDTAAITLSGGTIARGAGVSEVMGDLTLNDDSFLDYGSGAVGTLQFGLYSPAFKLTVNNFLAGNVLRFGSNLTTSIENTSLFTFDNAFSYNWNGSDTFTITAIPEPSTVLAAVGLAGLMLWPVGRRFFGRRKA